jgi:hypothetical protein
MQNSCCLQLGIALVAYHKHARWLAGNCTACKPELQLTPDPNSAAVNTARHSQWVLVMLPRHCMQAQGKVSHTTGNSAHSCPPCIVLHAMHRQASWHAFM